MNNSKNLNSTSFITLLDIKTNSVKKCTLAGHFYKLCKRYMPLRPTNLNEKRFFLNYQNKECTRHWAGINKLMQIATFF